MENLRKYGKNPYNVAVIHGGPGAPGEMAPVARELSAVTGILEPMQTVATVEGQIRELKGILEANGDIPVTLIGYSWGAMLGFMLTARYPELVRKLILVGSGAFESKYAGDIMDTRLSRLSKSEAEEVVSLMKLLNDPAITNKDTLMMQFGLLMSRSDSYDPVPHDNEILGCSYEIHNSVWRQAVEMRSSGELLELGRMINCPVLAVHGDYDPHPPDGVRIPLAGVIKDFRFVLLEKCGHCPWIERNARDVFYDILRKEILLT